MEVKDQATATEAALNLNKGSETAVKPGEPVTPRKKSTAEVLFPEFTTDDGAIVNRPVRESEGPKPIPSVPATPVPAPVAPAPAAPAPTATGILDLSKLPADTMVRMKVDGVEIDVPASTAIKNMQLERHLTLQSQKLAADRAALEAERASFRQTPKQPPEKPSAPVPKPDPSPDAARIAQLEADIASLRATVAPQLFDSGVRRLADRAKSEFGADDFNSYVPRIKEFVDGEVAKPEVAANPQILQALDNPDFWYSKYQELKLKDLIAGKVSAPASSPVLTPTSVAPAVEPIKMPEGTTAVIDRNGNAVPIPVFEGSSGVPSRNSPSVDWQARYQEALETAKKVGTNEAWQVVFKLKREPEQ